MTDCFQILPRLLTEEGGWEIWENLSKCAHFSSYVPSPAQSTSCRGGYFLQGSNILLTLDGFLLSDNINKGW